MLRLTHRPDVASAVLGEACLQRLVFPIIVKDGTDMVRPLVLTKDDAPVAVFLPEVEQPALAVARDAPVILHGYYFTWDTEPRASLADCVAREAAGRQVTLDAGVPAALHQTLSGVVPIALSAMQDLPALYATALPRAEVESAWTADDSALRNAARLAAAKLEDPRGPAIVERQGSDRFASLDRTLEDAGLAGVFATSPIHVQGLTGLSIDDIVRHGTAALYLRGDCEIVLLRLSPNGGEERRLGRFVDVIDALSTLAKEPVGYEDLHLPFGTVQRLLDRSLEIRSASGVLRKWETRTAGANAPGFLIASMATVQGIEYAIDRAQELCHQGRTFTEVDLDSIYREAVGRFAASVGLPNSILPYFDIIQAGERTVYPAVPTSCAITERTRTVKFDMGVQVVDSRGLIRGCSDLARTCAFGDKATAMAAALDHVLLEGLPRTLRAGVSGADMYRGGLAALREHESAFRRLGYLLPSRTIEGYHRDCGHALGRQTPSSVHFLPNDHEVVEEGMVVCLELVWPVGDEVFAHEDIWIVDHDRPVNITRHTGWVWT
jgi:Xaa-Pro aminopeptidase